MIENKNNKESEEIEEKQALTVFENEENAEGVVTVIKDTFHSYANKPKEQPLAEWVEDEFKKYPDSFGTEDEIKKDVVEVIDTIEILNENRDELHKLQEKKKTTESWFVKKIEDGAKATNTLKIGEYANNIDKAMENANQLSVDTFINLNGNINQNQNLHGFVAENHHTNSFNLNASMEGSRYRAQMLQNTNKNSVDIVIKDMIDGKIVRKYGSKYGQTSSDTQSYLNKGDYRGQRKLVPDGQHNDIEKATNHIEIDGIKSEPLSYEKSREIQKEIQQHHDIQEFKWDKVGKLEVAKSLVAQTGKIIALLSLFQGARILGRRVYNKVTGKENQSVNQDIKEWLDSSWVGAKVIAVQTVVSTATVIAVRKGLIPKLASNTPAGKIAYMAYIGMENAKVVYKIAKGDISLKEGFKEMEVVTSSAVGGLAGSIVGGAKGAALGTTLGPVGTAVGGFIGAVVGGMAGSKAGEMIAKTHQKVRKTVIDKIKTSYNSVKKSISKMFSKTLIPAI